MNTQAFRLLCGASVLVATGLAAFAQRGPASDPTLLGLIGAWNPTVEDGRPILTHDGLATTLVRNENAMRTVFGAAAGGFVTAASAAGVFPLAAAGNVTDFRGGRLNVEFKLISGATDQSAGVVFNLKPDGTYNYARYNTKDGNVAIWKFEGGTRTVLQHGELHEQLAKGAWHRLSVTVTGPKIVATVNDRFRVEHTLAAPVSGRVGLWVKADSVTAFRGFEVAR